MDTPVVAAVVGAGSGIGRASAVRLAQPGTNLVLVDNDPDRLPAVAREVSDRCREVLIVQADVSDEAAVATVASSIARRWGRLDQLVVSAGINGVWAPLDRLTVAEWRRTIDVNLTGTFLVLHHLSHLLKIDRGSAVVVTSIHGSRVHSMAGSVAYACSKAAQVELVRKAALELAPSGVRVNAVCPGSTRTDIDRSRTKRDLERIDTGVRYEHGWIPLAPGTDADAEQVARVITFLLSSEADHVTGAELHVDGAQSLLMG